MKFLDVESLIASRLGFDIDSIGRKAVDAVLSRCMAENGCADRREFAELLARDPAAWQLLLSRLVVTESWFFRDTVPFELAVDHARAHLRRAPDTPFRVLTCPCSTGEEPYSVAMALLYARIPRDAFVIEAVDVNRGALESARAAEFGVRSFRGGSLAYRAAHFERIEETNVWRLQASVSSLVRFREGNLIDRDFLINDQRYDLVFCRNLLIYLLPEARLIAIRALRRLMARDSVLCLGNTEPAVVREHGFIPVGPAGAFAFKKGRSHPAPPITHTVAHTVAHPVAAVGRHSAPTHVPAPPPLPHPPRQVHASAPRERHAPATHTGSAVQEDDLALLEGAGKLANAGQLTEALELCGQYLRRAPGSAKAHYLCGVLQDALGHPRLAAESFRKTLYLNPSHRGALLHLALKREALGDRSGAALLRARASRSPDIDAAE